MSLHENYDGRFFSDNYEENAGDLIQKKRVKRLLEEKLERKRLREECKDDLDESDVGFNWDDLDM